MMMRIDFCRFWKQFIIGYNFSNYYFTAPDKESYGQYQLILYFIFFQITLAWEREQE